MTGGTLGGGVVIAIAAVLWLAYLVPTWLRRREYLNAERNAVRLQQMLRILAETAEAPEEVHVEATARDVARQQKLLKKTRQKAEAVSRAQAAYEARETARIAALVAAAQEQEAQESEQSDDREADAAQRRAQTVSEPGRVPVTSEVAAEAVSSSSSAGSGADASPSAHTSPEHHLSREERDRQFARAVRRTRLMTTGVVLASFVGLAFGIYSGMAAGSWWLLGASVALLVCAFTVLRRLAVQVTAHRHARRSRAVGAHPVAQISETELVVNEQVVVQQVGVGWEPQPLPKPLYQSPGTRAAVAMASLDAAVELRRAAARAEFDDRAARIAAAQVPALPVAKPVEPSEVAVTAERFGDAADSEVNEQLTRPATRPSKYASMGNLGEVESQRIDLDEALRRRRAAS